MTGRISSFESHKQRLRRTANDIIPRIEQIHKPTADRMRLCGNFVHVAYCTSCNARHYAGNNRCMNRWCLDCAHRRSLKYLAKFADRIIGLMKEGYSAHLLTFTIRDGNDLKERLEFLKRSWRTLQHDDKILREKFKNRLVGGVRTIEVKIGRGSGEWHPHYHCLILTPPGKYEKDYEWIQPAWKRITDGNGSIEIHKIKKRKKGVLEAILEVFKYIVSPDKWTLGVDDDRFREMFWTLRNMRMVNTWGLLRGIDKSAEEEAAEEFDEKKLVDFICRLCGNDEYEIRVLLAETLNDTYLLDI